MKMILEIRSRKSGLVSLDALHMDFCIHLA